MKTENGAVIKAIVHDLRLSWKDLALTDLVYKVITIILLAPLVGFLFRVMLALSGHEVLADQDILFFLISPLGLFCCIIVGSLWLGIGVLEQAALMGIIYARQGERRIGIVGALKFALGNSWSVIQVTGRLIVYFLLILAPFLIVAGLVYYLLLTEFDINY
jgi:glycerophosphoryl diester phosphodiesterase